MPTAEMRTLPQASSLLLSPKNSARQSQEPPPALFSSGWMTFAVWLLAAASLGASLAYMGAEERPPAAALGVSSGMVMPSPSGISVCASCGRVEAVKPLPVAERPSGRKRLFSVTVRMQDGHVQTVQVEKALSVGVHVTLVHGVLRLVDA